MATHLPRILLSLLFVIGGFNFLVNFSGTTQFVAMGLTPWGLAGIATLATVIVIILKLGGGLMLLVNYKTSYAAWMLIVFTVLATIVYHSNWSGADAQMQITNFLKNLAIIGGLFLYAKCFCKTCNGSAAATSTE
jgi:putative oxidoreductase